MKSVRIMAAINGARRTKVDHLALPMTAEEIGASSAACAKAGAAAIHLHVRDEAGRHSLDVGRYREAIAEIRRQAIPDLIIQITTESVGLYSPVAQMETVRALQPEAFSVAVRELFSDPELEGEAARFLDHCARAGIAAQYILYDATDLRRFEGLMSAGAIPVRNGEQLFVLGRHGDGPQSDPSAILTFLCARTQPLPWSVCAFGPAEAACCATAALLGGDVRMGFENNVQFGDGRTAFDNAALIESFCALVAPFGITPLQLRDARARLPCVIV